MNNKKQSQFRVEEDYLACFLAVALVRTAASITLVNYPEVVVYVLRIS
jgi:hypothetical protein